MSVELVLSGGGGSVYTVPKVADFSWVNQGSSVAADGLDQLVLHIPDDNTTLNWRGMFKSQPSTPYNVVMFVRTWQARAASQATGMYFRDSSGGGWMGIELLTQNSVNSLRVQRVTNPTTSGSTQTTIAWDAMWSVPEDRLCLRLRNSGSNLYWDYSPLGDVWVNVYSEAVGATLTPNQVGFGGVCVTSTVAPLVALGIKHWLAGSGASL